MLILQMADTIENTSLRNGQRMQLTMNCVLQFQPNNCQMRVGLKIKWIAIKGNQTALLALKKEQTRVVTLP